MPTYEYRCPEGHEFEKFQRMSDPPEAECPECGLKAARVLSGGAGLLFRGGGFYTTDYRSESYKKGAAKEKGDSKESKGESKGSSKGESTGSSEKSGGSSSSTSKSGE